MKATRATAERSTANGPTRKRRVVTLPGAKPAASKSTKPAASKSAKPAANKSAKPAASKSAKPVAQRGADATKSARSAASEKQAIAGADPQLTAAERRARSKAAPSIAPQTLAKLAVQHPDAHCELEHRNPFELIVSVVLSAQTTDVAVNKATPKLFATYPDARALAAAEPADVEPYVAALGFFRMKSRAIVGLARGLVEQHGGEVPRTMDALVKLPGVGRKTANVVLGVIWNDPEGVVVDTHVTRLSQRLGWSKNTEPEKIERDLCAILPRSEWDHASHLLIFHGRRCCYARKPECPKCMVNDVCPAAFDAEHVGRKPPRPRRSAD